MQANTDIYIHILQVCVCVFGYHGFTKCTPKGDTLCITVNRGSSRHNSVIANV